MAVVFSVVVVCIVWQHISTSIVVVVFMVVVINLHVLSTVGDFVVVGVHLVVVVVVYVGLYGFFFVIVGLKVIVFFGWLGFFLVLCGFLCVYAWWCSSWVFYWRWRWVTVVGSGIDWSVVTVAATDVGLWLRWSLVVGVVCGHRFGSP